MHYKQTNQTNNWKTSTASSSLCLTWHNWFQCLLPCNFFKENYFFSKRCDLSFFYIKFEDWETINWDLLMLSNFILTKVIIIRRRNCQYLPVKCYIMVCFNLFVLSNNVFHFRLIFSLWFIQQVLIILLSLAFSRTRLIIWKNEVIGANF